MNEKPQKEFPDGWTLVLHSQVTDQLVVKAVNREKDGFWFALTANVDLKTDEKFEAARNYFDEMILPRLN